MILTSEVNFVTGKSVFIYPRDRIKKISNKFPVHDTLEGRYLADALGEPLAKGLSEVARNRPKDPISYLANYLKKFQKMNNAKMLFSEGSGIENQGVPLSKAPEVKEAKEEMKKQEEREEREEREEKEEKVEEKPEEEEGEEEEAEEDEENEGAQTAFSATNRDEYGQSMLHFAAARSHGRNGLFQLIQESSINIGYRDELYRTARDVALQANIPENILEIDKYVLSLASTGETDKLIELLLEGYDHILDLEDDEDNNIMDVVSKKKQTKTLAFLKSIPSFQEKRELIQQSIRRGETVSTKRLLTENDGGKLLAVGKNTTGRCSLHIAVLCQQDEIVEFIAQKFPDTLKLGDNLERTALHYAMGVQNVEKLSNILIKCGAKRVLKDLKGRQPTYYFMNRSEIERLQEEEELLKN